jgi:multidrug efflux system outer membrane protein
MRRFALALPLLLAACEAGPNYVKPTLPTPPAYAESGATARTAIPAEDADLSSWWSGLGDAELDSLVRRALKDNPDLEAAAAKVREARAQETTATAGLFPSISGSGNVVKYDSQRGSSGATQTSNASGASGGSSGGGLAGLPIPSHLALYSAGFDATWEADIFGGVRRGIEAAKANTEAAEWARRDGQVSLVAETANAYLTLRAVQARIALGETELKRQQDLFQLISARRQHGFVTELDVNQQTTQVAQAAAQIPQLRAQADAEIHALGVLIGQTPESLTAELSPDQPLPPPPMRLPAGLPSELLLRRPDLRQAERRLAAANAEVGVQTANLYPKLNLLGLASFASPQIQSLLSTQNISTVGVGMLQVPLFDAGRRGAAVKAANEEREQAFQAYRGAVLGAFREVEDALAKFRSEDERRTHLVEASSSAERNLKIAQDQYGAGTVAFINVLQAETTLLNSRDQLVQSDAEALSDLVALYKALGGGWSAAG